MLGQPLLQGAQRFEDALGTVLRQLALKLRCKPWVREFFCPPCGTARHARNPDARPGPGTGWAVEGASSSLDPATSHSLHNRPSAKGWRVIPYQTAARTRKTDWCPRTLDQHPTALATLTSSPEQPSTRRSPAAPALSGSHSTCSCSMNSLPRYPIPMRRSDLGALLPIGNRTNPCVDRPLRLRRVLANDEIKTRCCATPAAGTRSLTAHARAAVSRNNASRSKASGVAGAA